MSRDRSQRASRNRFADAVLDFAADPTPANLVRYLAASRALEESPRRGRATSRRTAMDHKERMRAPRPSWPLHPVVDERGVLRLTHAQVLQVQRAREPLEQALAAAQHDR